MVRRRRGYQRCTLAWEVSLLPSSYPPARTPGRDRSPPVSPPALPDPPEQPGPRAPPVQHAPPDPQELQVLLAPLVPKALVGRSVLQEAREVPDPRDPPAQLAP